MTFAERIREVCEQASACASETEAAELARQLEAALHGTPSAI